jgi:TPR repeat protein
MREVAGVNVEDYPREAPAGLAAAQTLVSSDQFNIGKAYAEGVHLLRALTQGTGVAVDFVEAERWWTLAAREGSASGNVEAQNRLGELFGSPRRRTPTDPLDIVEPVQDVLPYR